MRPNENRLLPKACFKQHTEKQKMSWPYLLSGTVMFLIIYLLLFLIGCNALNDMKSGGILQMLLNIGSVYVLGLDKRNLEKVMLWDNIVAAATALLVGLCGG